MLSSLHIKVAKFSLTAKLIGEGLPPSSMVQIIVRDNGPGIPREELQNILTVFIRASSITQMHKALVLAFP
jgi:signal transduction histidine kinase